MNNDRPVDDVLDIVKQFVNYFEDVEEKINKQDEESKIIYYRGGDKR